MIFKYKLTVYKINLKTVLISLALCSHCCLTWLISINKYQLACNSELLWIYGTCVTKIDSFIVKNALENKRKFIYKQIFIKHTFRQVDFLFTCILYSSDNR